MLEIFECRNVVTYPEEGRTLIKRVDGEKVEILAVSGYLIWLSLMVANKNILLLYLSPHQLGRIGKYLADSKWRGGLICPSRSEPEGCSIDELNDQLRYQRMLKGIESHRSNIEKNKESPAYMTEYDKKMIPKLEIESLLLQDSTRFGLAFRFMFASPRMDMDWLPEDPEDVAAMFLEVTKAAYDMREPVQEAKVDLTDWKRKLFEV